MASSLSVKLGVIDHDFSEGLEKNARKFRLFGRELNQGAVEMGRSLGTASQSVGKLGAGFQLAGTAAGLFAGADGLLGIAGSLASGGIVLGGMAAMSLALNQFERDAEEAKGAVEQFNKEIGKLPQNARGLSELKRIQGNLEGALNSARARQEAQRSMAGGAEGAAGLGTEIARQGGLVEYVKGLFGASSLDRTIKQLSEELENTTQAADDLGNALNTPEEKAKQFGERIDGAAQSVAFLAKTSEPIAGLFGELALLSAQVDANLRAAGDPMSKNAILARQQATALEDAYNAAAKIQNAQAATRAFRYTQAGYPGAVGGIGAQVAVTGMALNNTAYANQLHGNAINPLGFGDLKPELFDPVHELVDGTAHVRLAIENGLKALPDAIGGVLGPLILGVFGNSQGAQIGGALGGAFGTGIGAYIGTATLGAAVGSAFAPVIGTVIGAAIGSLFGGHKHAIDTNTAAVNANTRALEQLTNVPEGYKVNRAAFRAQDAVSIIMDGREVAKAVLNTLRRESQAQFGTTTRIAEVSL